MGFKSDFFSTLSMKTAIAAGLAGVAISLTALLISLFICLFYAKEAQLKASTYSALAFARSISSDGGASLAKHAEDFGADYAFTFQYDYLTLKIYNLNVSGGYYVSETELLSGLSSLGRSPVSVINLTTFDKISYTAIYARVSGTENSYGGLIFHKKFMSLDIAKKLFPQMLWTLIFAPLFAAIGFWAGKNTAKQIKNAARGLKEAYSPSYGANPKETAPLRRDINLIHTKIVSAHNEYHKIEERKEKAEKELLKLKEQVDKSFFNKAVILESEAMDLRIQREKLLAAIEHCENLLIRDSNAVHGEALFLPFLKYFEGCVDASHALLLKGEYEDFFAQISKMGEDISRMNAFLATPSAAKKLPFPELAEKAILFIKKLFKLNIPLCFSDTAQHFECSLEFAKVLASNMAVFTKFARDLRVSAETYSEDGERHLLVVLSAKRKEGCPLEIEENVTREIVTAVFGGNYTLFKENDDLFAEFRI